MAFFINRLTLAAFIIPLASLGFTACTAANSNSSTPTSQLRDEVTIGVGDDVPVVRPWGDGTINIARNISLNIYGTLVGLDTNGTVIPALASSWEVSPDGKTYTFKLRKDAKYINGDPVTPDDIAFAFANSKDPKKVPIGISAQQHWLRE